MVSVPLQSFILLSLFLNPALFRQVFILPPFLLLFSLPLVTDIKQLELKSSVLLRMLGYTVPCSQNRNNTNTPPKGLNVLGKSLFKFFYGLLSVYKTGPSYKLIGCSSKTFLLGATLVGSGDTLLFIKLEFLWSTTIPFLLASFKSLVQVQIVLENVRFILKAILRTPFTIFVKNTVSLRNRPVFKTRMRTLKTFMIPLFRSFRFLIRLVLFSRLIIINICEIPQFLMDILPKSSPSKLESPMFTTPLTFTKIFISPQIPTPEQIL